MCLAGLSGRSVWSEVNAVSYMFLDGSLSMWCGVVYAVWTECDWKIFNFCWDVLFVYTLNT